MGRVFGATMEQPRELFVISDLHLGGKYGPGAGRGFRINTRVDVLAGFVEEVAARAKDTTTDTELVINGDFVDFLAEETPADSRRRAFIADQDQATATLDAIAARDRTVFDALRAALESGVGLTVILGNHDIELSLPAVRARLAALLGAERGRRFRFVYDGEAYVAGDVLIEHGNRYDGWNAIDHDRLRRLRSECSRRLENSPEAHFFPPAGSELVERLMNPIKHDYPFIDLLKPETDAAIPLLLTLEPDLVTMANGIATARLQRQAASHAPAAPARPAQPGDIAGVGGFAGGLAPLRSVLAGRLRGTVLSELLALVEDAERQDRATRGQIAASAPSRALSFLRLKLSPSYESRLRILLGAVRSLRDDKSFEFSQETGREYLDAAQALAARGFRTIVFGHTHLAKDVPLTDRSRYLNTGTWADLLRVPPEILNAADGVALTGLSTFAQAIRDKQFGDYLMFRPTFAHVRLDGAGSTVAATVTNYEVGTVRAA